MEEKPRENGQMIPPSHRRAPAGARRPASPGPDPARSPGRSRGRGPPGRSGTRGRRAPLRSESGTPGPPPPGRRGSRRARRRRGRPQVGLDGPAVVHAQGGPAAEGPEGPPAGDGDKGPGVQVSGQKPARSAVLRHIGHGGGTVVGGGFGGPEGPLRGEIAGGKGTEGPAQDQDEGQVPQQLARRLMAPPPPAGW